MVKQLDDTKILCKNSSHTTTPAVAGMTFRTFYHPCNNSAWK
ncbi:hypothetical protein [Rickettsia endosymbiont of Orchestes rusci]